MNNRPPLTRTERVEQTRARVLTAARTLFLTQGYEPTSLPQIAAAAGHTTGAVSGHFRHKHDLGHAVAEPLFAHALQRIRSSRFDDRTALETALARWAWLVIRHPQWIHLELELAALGGAHRIRYHRRLNHLRFALADLLTRTPQPAADHDPTMTADLLVAAVVGHSTASHHHAPVRSDWVRSQIALVLRNTTT